MPTKSSKLGRPSKLTPELQQQICTAIARGHYATTACAAAGVGEATYFRWLELGSDHLEKRGDRRVRVAAASPYREFREAVEKAKAVAQMAHMETIRDAAFTVEAGADGVQRVRAKNWTASAWYLERTAPHLFARREVVHTDPTATPKRPDDEPRPKVVRFGGRFKADGAVHTSAQRDDDR
jgi:hypothetical protein